MIPTDYNKGMRYIFRSRLLRIGFSAFILGAVYLIWAYFSHLLTWEDRLAEKISLQRELQHQIKTLKQTQNVVNTYKTALEIFNKTESRLSTNTTQVALAEEVNALARKSGVNITASTFKLDKPNEGVKKSHQEIVLAGDYADIKYFLAGLSRLSVMTIPTEIFIQKEAVRKSSLIARIHLISYQDKSLN